MLKRKKIVVILHRERGEEWVNDGGSVFFVLVDLGSLIITVKNKIYVFFFFLIYVYNDGVHPHVALSATRGKASPSLKGFFSHVLWQFLRPVSSHVCWLVLRNKCSFDFLFLQMPINRQATYQIKSFQSQVFFCNPIEREPRELKRGEKNRE